MSCWRFASRLEMTTIRRGTATDYPIDLRYQISCRTIVVRREYGSAEITQLRGLVGGAGLRSIGGGRVTHAP
jgi:hypothetical protein